MSVNSLSSFGVPGLSGERGPQLQPIFSHLFRVLFFNFGTNGEIAPYDLTRQVKTINRPTVKFDVMSLHSYVSTVYVVSRGEWGELKVQFADDITNSVMARVQNQVAKQQNFFDQTTSRAGENYKFELDLDVLAGGASAGGSVDPNIIQKWSYSGCLIRDVNYGEMNVDDAKPVMIDCTIKYDNVIAFDENGTRMGTFSHAPEISAQLGVLSTGNGAAGGLSVSINGASVSVGVSGLSLGSNVSTSGSLTF